MNLKKKLRQMYVRVGRQAFCKGIRNAMWLALIAVFVVMVSSFLSACRKEEPPQIVVHEVRTSGVTYQTSEVDNRVKEPVVNENVYLIIEGGTLAWK